MVLEEGLAGSRVLWLRLWDLEEVGLASSTAEVPVTLRQALALDFFSCKNCRSNCIFFFKLSASSFLFPPLLGGNCMGATVSAQGPHSCWNTYDLGGIVLWLSELLFLPFWLPSASGMHYKIFRLLCFYCGLRPRSYNVKMPQVMQNRMWYPAFCTSVSLPGGKRERKKKKKSTFV